MSYILILSQKYSYIKLNSIILQLWYRKCGTLGTKHRLPSVHLGFRVPHKWYQCGIRDENTRVYVHLGTTVPNHLSEKHTKNIKTTLLQKCYPKNSHFTLKIYHIRTYIR